MTGNKNAWRAPLAGLASLAMIATMGVAAGTANAVTDDYDLSWEVNGKVVYTETQNDGKIDAADLNAPTTGLPSGAVFTGWTYEDGTWVTPGARLDADTTLVAQYDNADSVYTVDFTGGNFAYDSAYDLASVGDIANGIEKTASGYEIKVPSGKTLSAAQVPGDDEVADQKILSGWDNVEPSTGTVLTENADPTGDLSGLAGATSGQNRSVKFVSRTADAYTINFQTTGFKGASWQFTDTELQDKVANGALSVDVLLGKGYGTLPQVKNTANNQTTTAWSVVKTNGEKGDSWTASSSKNAVTTVDVKPDTDANVESAAITLDYSNDPSEFPQSDTTIYPGKDEALSDALPTPDNAKVTRGGIQYEFAGWTTASGVQFKEGTSELTNEVKGNAAAGTLDGATVYAQWKAVKIAVQFDPGYDQKDVVTTWFADGDSFAVPGFTRSGYTRSWNPINADKLVDYTLHVVYTSAKGWRMNLNNDGGSFYPDFKFTATWTKNGYEGLQDALKVIPQAALHVDRDLTKRYLNADEQDVFTSDSFEAYVKFAKTFYTELAKYNGKYTVDQATALAKELNEANASLQFKKTESVYRLYSEAFKRHLVTSSKVEKDFWQANGYKYEGEAFKTIDAAALVEFAEGKTDVKTADIEASDAVDTLLTAVHRLYNPGVDRQHLTPQANEIEVLTTTAGWRDEGVAFYAAANGTTPVYRVYIPSTLEHLWTTSANEYDTLGKNPGVYQQEGVDFSL